MTGKNIICRGITDVPFISCFVIIVSYALQVLISDLLNLTHVGDYNRDMFTANISNGKTFPALIAEWIVRKSEV